MHKVVTERPRYGHSNPSRKWRARVTEDFEGETFVSSSRRRQGSRAKSLSDFLSPIRRYLRSQTGRPWDKVYSEIRKAMPRGLQGEHLWMHIRSEVSMNCIERDGRIFARPRFYSGEVEVSGLYVHPRTGLLCFKERASQSHTKAPAAPLRCVKLGENEEYRQINGIWYYQQFVRLEAPGPPVFELIEKKQLNRRELQNLRETYGSGEAPIEKPARL